MTFGARFGSLALVVMVPLGMGVLVGTAPAQTETPGEAAGKPAQTETPSTWTDPPVRGAAGPKASDSDESTKNAAAPEKAVPAKPVEEAVGPQTPASAVTERAAAAQVRPAPRSAKVRREQIRVAAHSRVLAEASMRRPRYGRIARVHEEAPPARAHRRLAERRAYAYRAYRPASPRSSTRFAMRDDSDVDPSPYRARRAGWGGLIGDDREGRIAQARAAGYIVIRSRTYAYPDGSRVREMTPYAPYGLE